MLGAEVPLPLMFDFQWKQECGSNDWARYALMFSHERKRSITICLLHVLWGCGIVFGALYFEVPNHLERWSGQPPIRDLIVTLGLDPVVGFTILLLMWFFGVTGLIVVPLWLGTRRFLSR